MRIPNIIYLCRHSLDASEFIELNGKCEECGQYDKDSGRCWTDNKKCELLKYTRDK
jgi:hypothetical protein